MSDIEHTEKFGDMVPYGDPTWYQEWYNPYYNDSHHQLRKAARKYVEEELLKWIPHSDSGKDLPKEVLLRAGELGVLAAFAGHETVREHFKGKLFGIVDAKDADAFHISVIADELNRTGHSGLVSGLTTGPMIALNPVAAFGNEKLREKVVQDVIMGRKRIALAITEPSAGSDVANVQTEAKLNAAGTHYIVNGQKKWITNGTDADYFSVAVRTGGKGFKGISLLLIEREMGVKTRPLPVMGLHGSGTSFVIMEDVEVPVENIIGEVNEGFKAIMFNFNHERLGIVIGCVRLARVCYEECFKYANKRRTFGKPLIQHAVIREKLAHMIRQIEATQHWCDHILFQTNHMPTFKQMMHLAGPIALLKLQSTKVLDYCAREACQIFGGAGYTKGGQGEKIERIYRDVRGYAIPGGSEEIMAELGANMAMRIAKVNQAKL